MVRNVVKNLNMTLCVIKVKVTSASQRRKEEVSRKLSGFVFFCSVLVVPSAQRIH